MLEAYPHRTPEILSLIKHPYKIAEAHKYANHPLLWYINPQNKVLKV